MQGIYSHVPVASHISRVCTVAASLYLQFNLGRGRRGVLKYNIKMK